MQNNFSPNTIAGKKIAEMEKKGYTYKGFTTGLFSFRKGSNLHRKLVALGLDQDKVKVCTGAHLQRGTQGWQLLIFVKNE